MVNVVCVKYSDKYSEKHVNILYEMVKRNLSLPFSFYCLTENSNGLHPDILHVPLDEEQELETYWYKLTIFDKDIYGNDDLTLYLDLDTIVQNPLDDLFQNPDKPLKIVPTGKLRPKEDEVKYIFGKHQSEVNSSIMLFIPSKTYYITKHFLQDPDFYILEYQGVCRYLWYFFKDDMEYFKIVEDFYPVFNKSQVWLDLPDHEKEKALKLVKVKKGRLGINFVPHSKIAMMNGASRDNVLDELYEYFSSYYK